LDEINEYLRTLGLREVSPRMHIHYRRLHRHGYDSYIPINRLDIALAGDDAWSDELQARYPEVSQPFDAELIWNASITRVTVESLGVSTATVRTEAVPRTGEPVVLRLLTARIERGGTVIRADRAASRIHVAFDPFHSVPLAPADAPAASSVSIQLPDNAKNLAAITDVVLKLDRFLIRADTSRKSLTRIRSFSMASPLEFLLAGSEALIAALAVLGAIVLLRKQWYEGTKSKYEAEGIHLDNEQRRSAAQTSADEDLKRALDAEVGAADPKMLKSLAQPGLPVGDPASPQRQQLADIAKAAIDLPQSTSVQFLDDPTEHE
jgi:hypothetical protein